jgi:branched-chain amino acid transport system substrate-binding protein
MTRHFRRAALAALALLLVAPPVVAQEAPLEINAILPLTGQGAFIGKTELQSLQVLENITNANGGIKGRPIKFTVVDDGSTPAVALQLASQIAAKGAQIIIGPGLTATCSAVLPLLTKGPFTYCLAPGIHPPAGSYMMSANSGTGDLIVTELRYARARGWTRLAFILTTDASGQDLGEKIDEALALPENKSIQIVARQVFAPTDISVGAQIQNIKSGVPQVLITATSGTPFGTILRGAHDAGLDVPIISLSSNMHLDQLMQYTSFMPKELLFVSSRGAVQEPQADPKVKQAQKTFFDAFKRAGIVVSNGHSVPWDAVSIVIDALRSLGPNATAAQLRTYVTSLQNYNGIDGNYDFRAVPQRGIGDQGTIIYAWDGVQKDFTIASKPRGQR